ncbi:MAG: hypothetical protein R3F59_32540 [Myxococcota bacterium]
MQERIRAGEVIRPSGRMLDKARRALGRHLETDAGLTVAQRLGLLATSVLVTPLLSGVLFVWWWECVAAGGGAGAAAAAAGDGGVHAARAVRALSGGPEHRMGATSA